MKKKLFMLISIILAISSFVLINQLQTKNFTVFNTVNPELLDEIKKDKLYVPELEFTALLCNEIRVPFDENNNIFYIPIDMNVEQWETMSFSSGQPEYKILFAEDITDYPKKEVIAQGKQIPLYVYDGEFYSQYQVVFTGLPIIDLSTNEGFYAAEEITGTAIFFDTDFSSHGTKQSAYNGHIRGNTSRMFPKKGYKINLRTINSEGVEELNKLSLFGMRKDDDWILHALYNDDTKIRDRLSMEVWDRFGAKAVSEKSYYGPRMIYVEVFADNSYCGLYGLMEPVDGKQLDLAERDYSYKRKNPGSLYYQYFDFFEERNPYAEVEGFEIKDGPLDDEADLWEAIADLSSIISEEDHDFKENQNNMINEESALNLWLFLQIITGHDHTAKNVFYVAKYNDDLRHDYEFYFAPWDMDLTWGNVSVGEINPVYTAFEYETVQNRVYWDVGDRLLDVQYEGCREYVQNLYEELRSTVLTDQAIENLIFDLDSELRNSGAFARDKQRWSEGVYSSDCKQLVSYAKERLDFLDKALYDLEYYDD